MDYHERKAARKEYFLKYKFGWKEIDCVACSGSGYYDHNGSPECGGCDGTGKETISPGDYKELQEYKAKRGIK